MYTGTCIEKHITQVHDTNIHILLLERNSLIHLINKKAPKKMYSMFLFKYSSGKTLEKTASYIHTILFKSLGLVIFCNGLEKSLGNTLQ